MSLQLWLKATPKRLSEAGCSRTCLDIRNIEVKSNTAAGGRGTRIAAGRFSLHPLWGRCKSPHVSTCRSGCDVSAVCQSNIIFCQTGLDQSRHHAREAVVKVAPHKRSNSWPALGHRSRFEQCQRYLT